MDLLVKRNDRTGLAMHIADALGKPICKTRLKLEAWYINPHPTQTDIICANCRHIYARKNQ